MRNKNEEDSCPGRTCDWLGESDLYCVDGSKGDCKKAGLLESEKSNFHDDKLMKATKNINDILDNLREESDERKLSFVITDLGILLAWTHRGKNVEDFPDDIVTSDSDSATIIETLKLKNVTSS